MKTTLASLIGLGIVLLGVSPSFAADDVKKIPLETVYTTTAQKGVEDATAHLAKHLKDDTTRLIALAKAMSRVGGKPAIFLVSGKDFPAAFDASLPFLPRDGEAPNPKAETRAGQRQWVGAYLGSNGSIPPAYRLLSVEVEGTKVRVTYETVERNQTTLDNKIYLVLAPLGELPAGDYTLELYDAAAKKVTATHKGKVTKQ